MKLSLNTESVNALRDFADRIPHVTNKIIEDTKKLLNTYHSVAESTGPHNQDFLEMLFLVKSAQGIAEESLKELSVMLHSTADKMEAYINYGSSGSGTVHLRNNNNQNPANPVQAVPIDYQAVYEGLEEYDFDGINYLADCSRLDDCLDSFTDHNWEERSLLDKKDAIESLKGYIQDVVGLNNPPEVVYYVKPDCFDYGGYNDRTNTLQINTYSLDQHAETPPGVNVAQEAADTVAHELWHAYQYQCAEHPRSGAEGSIDFQRQFGLKNYVRPVHDNTGRCINFEDYQDQLVEAEARAFAEQFKGRLAEILRRN